MNELDNQLIEQEKPRPGFLTTLCVLTFITTGLGVFSSISSLISGPLSDEQMMESKVALAKSISQLKDAGMDSWVGMMEKIQAMTIQANDHFYTGTMLSFVAASIGAFAAMKMWKGYKQGFHFYIIYSLISVGSIYLYISPSNIPSVIIVVNLLLSGLFIFMYSRNLHWMTK